MKRDFSTNPAKEELRRAMRERLRAMDPATRAEASLLMCGTAARLPAFATGRCIALFAPLASEPDIHPLIEEAWAQGKRVVLPLMIRQASGPQLDWHEVSDWEDVVMPGPFGLREPDPLRCPRVASSEIDCAFVPGLAFDDTGLRLGRGGGFYDYFLAQAGPSRGARRLPSTTANVIHVGLMFGCQRVGEVPREPHDQPLPGVITEEGLVEF